MEIHFYDTGNTRHGWYIIHRSNVNWVKFIHYSVLYPREYSRQKKKYNENRLTECSFRRRFNSVDFILDAVDIDGAFVISFSISLSQRLSLRGSPTRLCVRVDGPIDWNKFRALVMIGTVPSSNRNITFVTPQHNESFLNRKLVFTFSDRANTIAAHLVQHLTHMFQ